MVESRTPWIGKKRATVNYISALRTMIYLQERRNEIALEPGENLFRETEEVKAELVRLENAE
jgi:hypothetical protein